VFYLLRTFLGLALTLSSILSSEIAIINNFLWNDAWTFADTSKGQMGICQRIKRFLKFNCICLVGMFLNASIVNLLFDVFCINEYLAKLIAIVMVTLLNFWLNSKLSWRDN
jgi:dolichol-phosphate mannosyltransferase